MAQIAATLTETPRRAPSAIDRAIAQMADGAAREWDGAVAANARLMLAEPWRICRVLSLPTIWPVEEADLTDLLAKAAGLLRASVAQGRSGSWVYSTSLHIAREAAVDALLAMVLDRRKSYRGLA